MKAIYTQNSPRKNYNNSLQEMQARYLFKKKKREKKEKEQEVIKTYNHLAVKRKAWKPALAQA